MSASENELGKTSIFQSPENKMSGASLPYCTIPGRRVVWGSEKEKNEKEHFFTYYVDATYGR
eukprot:CCRYP_011995-RA/>CCRYP_011995-RA protein AED:0.00 eAED:0.00 QI:76/1/1/1/0/0/2/53/61